ncbi:MAG: sodium/proton-translocating pyrophosphatase, partial [Alphaproteobacteria bacterium]|nr:sodium/proton-translocating pyrophosphatase [Alphaproteobacteria bacterium]
MDPMTLYWFAPVGALIALVFAYLFYQEVNSYDEGNDTMREIAGHVREGAMACLEQQYREVAKFFAGSFVLLMVLSFGMGMQSKWVPFAFVTGGAFSALAGYIGMKTATNASARTAEGARHSLNRGLTVAFRAGSVMGLTVVGLGLLYIAFWFYILKETGLSVSIFGESLTLQSITTTMLAFGMGASFQALFARVGGGIFTKAADVGADLVGKVEAGIPEDDPRNPATIADNVGDNVGDVAGMGADLFESYLGSILAAATLGVAAGLGLAGVVLPMVIAAAGI